MQLSLSEAWEDAQAFIRREAGLLLPLAFATLGVALLIYELIVPDPKGGAVPTGPWMFGMVPVLLLFMIGCLAISALVVLPRMSVSDALRTAFARIGSVILLLIAFSVASALLIMLLSLVAAGIGAALGWSLMRSSVFAVVMAIPFLLWISVRLLPLWALLAERGGDERIVPLVRRCMALTRGTFWRLLAGVLVFMLTSLLVTSAIQFSFGSVLLLIGRAVGSPNLGFLLTAVLMALAGSAIQMAWIVYVAQVYRRLAANSGT